MDEISLINQTNTIVLLIKDKKIAYSNRYANSFFGYDNMIGVDVIGTIVPKTESSGRDLENLIENLQKNPQKYQLNINENITSRGDVVWIVWSNSQYIDSNGEKLLLSIGIEATDFVERKKMNETIFHNSLNGIAMINPQLNVMDCNYSFIKMLGFKSKEELFKEDRDETSAFRRYVKELSKELLDDLKKHDSAIVQREFLRYDGKSFVADAVYSAIKNLKGEIVGYVINLHDNTDMYRKATTDKLTKIYNRMHFEELAIYEIKRSLRTGNHLSLIICDIDHFKIVNDTYGHLCGDIVLKGITSEIKSMLRATDIFARVGGEEFAILLPATSGKDAYNLAQKIKNAIAGKTFDYDYNTFGVTMSFGISELISQLKSEMNIEKSLMDLFKLVDQRLYYSKEHGRNRITYI